MLKVTSKNGKTASPVGFVTFNSRAGADAAKQDLQVRNPTFSHQNLQICNLTDLYSIYDLSHTNKGLPAKAAEHTKLSLAKIL